MKLSILVGSGRKIALLSLPVLIIGIALNILFPEVFSAGGPPKALAYVSAIILVPGVVIWMWSVILILIKIPRKELITNGPFSLVKHPLYTSVALLVLPWAGILANTFLGVIIGITVYIGSRLYSPEEEKILSKIFGKGWDDYCKRVKIPWL